MPPKAKEEEEEQPKGKWDDYNDLFEDEDEAVVNSAKARALARRIEERREELKKKSGKKGGSKGSAWL